MAVLRESSIVLHSELHKEANMAVSQNGDTGVGQGIEQEITEAFQPMLDEFRQQISHVLSDQLATMQMTSDGESDTSQVASRARGGRAPAAPEAAPSEGEQEREFRPESGELQVRNIQQAGAQAAPGGLSSVVQTVGHYTAQLLKAPLIAGLGALLAESTHATVQQRAEQELHSLLQRAFEAAPPDFANQDLLGKIEGALRPILRDVLDALFSEGVRVSLERGGEQSIDQALHGNLGSALSKVEEAPQVLITTLGTVLRRHQRTILRLLLALSLLAVGYSLAQSEKGK